MLYSKLKGILWLVFVGFFFILSDTYFGYVLLILTLVLFALLYISVFVTRNKVDIAIQTTGTMNKNNVDTFIIKAKNKAILPIGRLAITIVVYHYLTGETTEQVIYLSLNGKTTERISVDMKSKYCGKLEINVEKIVVYDFLNLFSASTTVNMSESVYVLPNTFAINIYEDVEQITNLDNAYEQSEAQGVNNGDLIGISEYVPGDNLKHIHWKLTSKFDELIVKEFSEPIDHSYLVLLETSIYEGDKKDPPIVADAIVETFVSISKSLIKEGKTHSIGWFNHNTNHFYTEEVHSLDQLIHLFRTILMLENRESETSVIEHCFHTGDYDLYSHIVYINSLQSNQFKIDDRLLHKATFLTCSEKLDDINSEVEKEIYFTPENMKEELSQLTI